MPLLNDAKTCFVGTTPITTIMAGSVQVWPKGSHISGKPYPTESYYYFEAGAGVNLFATYFKYDVPDLMLWEPSLYPSGEPEIDDYIRFPVYDPAINESPSGTNIALDRSVWYLGKRLEFGKTIYSYRQRSRSTSTTPPPNVTFNYTITINNIVSDVAEADLHWP